MAPIHRLIFRSPAIDHAEQDAAEARRTAGLAGIAVTLALLVAGLFLIKQLHHAAQIEDCFLGGQNNCDIVVMPVH